MVTLEEGGSHIEDCNFLLYSQPRIEALWTPTHATALTVTWPVSTHYFRRADAGPSSPL